MLRVLVGFLDVFTQEERPSKCRKYNENIKEMTSSPRLGLSFKLVTFKILLDYLSHKGTKQCRHHLQLFSVKKDFPMIPLYRLKINELKQMPVLCHVRIQTDVLRSRA
jgi:hypothetical protein